MKIVSIKTSKVFDYYASDIYKELLRYKCENCPCSILGDDGNVILHFTIDYHPTLLQLLRVYLFKVQRITAGNMRLYEYELGVNEGAIDKNFVIDTNEQRFTCTLNNAYMDGYDRIVLDFKVIYVD